MSPGSTRRRRADIVFSRKRSRNTWHAAYPWGADPAGCKFANSFDQTTMAHYAGMDTSAYKTFDPMPCDDGWLNTSPIGSLAPNHYGVYDMIGNVGEWIEGCNDGGAAAAEPAPCAKRLVKGGSWGTLAHNLRIAERVPYPATHRDDSVGIRVARTLKSGRKLKWLL